MLRSLFAFVTVGSLLTCLMKYLVRCIMDFDFSRFVGFLLVYVINFFLGYYFLRSLLWSIVWCDKKGKYRKLKKLRDNRSFVERMKMDYLEDYVKEHKQNFKFWITIKKVYEILETVLLIFYIIFSFFVLKGHHCEFYLSYFIYPIICQAVVFSFVFMCQENDHLTKYDRIRIKRRHNRKR